MNNEKTQQSQEMAAPSWDACQPAMRQLAEGNPGQQEEPSRHGREVRMDQITKPSEGRPKGRISKVVEIGLVSGLSRARGRHTTALQS